MSEHAVPSDENFICFEVRVGSRRIGCTVSNEALEAASGLVLPSTTDSRRKAFDRFRMLIDAAARLKLGMVAPGSTAPVVLSSHDLRCVPLQPGMPEFGNARRTTA